MLENSGSKMLVRNGVVILNYNSFDLTIALVNQIVDYKSIYKICIIDNNSNDDFKDSFTNPKIHFIKNTINSGYNSGNNIGLKYLVDECDCDYVYIANPDVDFEDNSIFEMSKVMEEDKSLVLVSTKRFGYGGQNILQYFDFPNFKNSVKYCFFLGRRNHETRLISMQNKVIDNMSGVFYVNAIPGAFFGLKSSFLREIDFLYEGIFLYGEEIFIGRQAYNRGYKAGIINTSCYYHNHIKIKLSDSNRKLFFRDRISLVKYYEYFELLNWYQIYFLKFAIYFGTAEYNFLFFINRILNMNRQPKLLPRPICKHEASLYRMNNNDVYV